MNKTSLNGQQRAYEEALRGAVADLPAAEVQELVDAFREHLVEARAARPDASLHEILGPPERFAYEFRVASGFEDGPSAANEPPPAEAWWRRWMFPFGVLATAAGAVCFTISIVTAGNEGYALPSGALYVLGLLTAVSGHRYADPVTPAISELAHRPAARAFAKGYFALVKPLRGWGVVIVLDWYVIGGSVYSPAPTGFPFPDYLGLELGGLAVVLCAVGVSVWLGLRERHLGRWRALVVPVELILASGPVIAAVSYALHF
jgi:hypothetical protein